MEPLRANPSGVSTPDSWPVERRQRSRQKVHTPAYASFDGANALDLHEIVDLHEEGLSAQAPPMLELNQHFQLRLVLSDSKSSIPVAGRVVWSARGRVGIRLDELNQDSLKQLQEWLFVNAMAASVTDVPALPPAFEESPAVLEDRTLLLGALDVVQREVQSTSLDTTSALQLVAERALSFTNATGCAIAIGKGPNMVCLARAGADAPPLGAAFHTDAGFSGEVVRRGTMLRCDDAETDARVEKETCRSLGIRSMLAVPLLQNDSSMGLIEVFSPRSKAFRPRDEEVLARMAEFAQALIRREREGSAGSAESVPSPPVEAPFSYSADVAAEAEGIPFQRSHIILLVLVAALIALVLGYLTAPWVQRHFSSGDNNGLTDGTASASLARTSNTIKEAQRSTVNLGTTLEQLRQLAEKGDPAAQFGMGTHYAIGDGVKLDNVEAARWFTKAAEQGHVIAQDTMGAYYWAGRGVPKDLRKAYFWSFLGRAANNETSKYRINALNSILSREDIEAARQDAERWLQQHPRPSKAPTSNP